MLRRRSLGELLPTDITWGWESSVLNSALPPPRLRPHTWPEHQYPVSHTAASAGGSPAEAGGGCGSPRGQGHWQQKFWAVLLGVSPPGVQ